MHAGSSRTDTLQGKKMRLRHGHRGERSVVHQQVSADKVKANGTFGIGNRK